MSNSTIKCDKFLKQNRVLKQAEKSKQTFVGTSKTNWNLDAIVVENPARLLYLYLRSNYNKITFSLSV